MSLWNSNLRNSNLDKAAALSEFTKTLYGSHQVLLHRPVFAGNEREYLIDCIESNFVSSVGRRVKDFEQAVADFVDSSNAVAVVNGTAALHSALLVKGVKHGDEVITQALSFVATANAISYCGAKPIFIDVDLDTMGMSPAALEAWINENAYIKDNKLINRKTEAVIKVCLPMHTFGMPCRVQEISEICRKYKLSLIEDCAEALGSYAGDRHVGTFGELATLSFNGNKIITCGGGGMIINHNTEIAERLVHLTTTSKVPHAYEYYHDQVGYNYRLPNINAAIGLAQMERLDHMLEEKKIVAERYRDFCEQCGIKFAKPIDGTTSNNWLNAIILENRRERDEFLEYTNSHGVMTRPIWNLLSELPMYMSCERGSLDNAKWLVDRVVNIPSSAFA